MLICANTSMNKFYVFALAALFAATLAGCGGGGGGGTPAAVVGTPADEGGETPAVVGETPAEGGETPADEGSETPADEGGETPAGGGGTPAGGGGGGRTPAARIDLTTTRHLDLAPHAGSVLKSNQEVSYGIRDRAKKFVDWRARTTAAAGNAPEFAGNSVRQGSGTHSTGSGATRVSVLAGGHPDNILFDDHRGFPIQNAFTANKNEAPDSDLEEFHLDRTGNTIRYRQYYGDPYIVAAGSNSPSSQHLIYGVVFTDKKSNDDMNYLAGGIWLSYPGNDPLQMDDYEGNTNRHIPNCLDEQNNPVSGCTDVDPASDFEVGAIMTGAPFGGELDALSGEATYTGRARGVFFDLTATNEILAAGFSGVAKLTADFDDNTIVGVIRDFEGTFRDAGGISRRMPTSLFLDSAAIVTSSNQFNGSVSGGGYSGKWGGKFFGTPTPAGEPARAGGTFAAFEDRANAPTTSLIGVFGAGAD